VESPGTQGRVSDGAIHVTIAKFYRPSGRSNQERGILSDVVIPDVLDASNIGEEEYEYALPYTTISPARGFKPLQDLNTVIPTLRLESRKRVEASPAFEKIVTKMKKEKQDDSSTLVSLKKKDDSQRSDEAREGDADDPANMNFLRDRKIIHEKDVILKESAEILVDKITTLPKGEARVL
jgi:carboxyl-terminal processing protease